MGVCCIVFDIDGMLFEYCMHFLNIEKNPGGGGGGGVEFFLEKQFFLISRFILFSTLKKITKNPSVRPSVHHV